MSARFNAPGSANAEWIGDDVNPLPPFPFSIGCWFRRRSSAATINDALGGVYNSGAGDQWYHMFTTTSNQLAVQARQASPTQSTTTGTFRDGEWSLAVGIFPSNNSRLASLNGRLEGNNAAGIENPSGLNRYSIGAPRDSTPSDSFSGEIAHPFIYGKALNADDLHELYHELKSPLVVSPQHLVSYFDLIDMKGRFVNRVEGGIPVFKQESGTGNIGQGRPLILNGDPKFEIRRVYAVPAVGGNVTGTATQTLPSMSQAASGIIEFTGTIVQTLPSVTQAAAGTVQLNITGTIGQTLPSLTQSASGVQVYIGTIVQTLPSLTQSATGAVAEHVGTIAQTLPSLTQDASGVQTYSGTITQTLPSLAQAATGTVVVNLTGTIAQTLPSLTQAAVGTVAVGVTGTAVQTLPSLTQQAVGSTPILEACPPFAIGITSQISLDGAITSSIAQGGVITSGITIGSRETSTFIDFRVTPDRCNRITAGGDFRIAA